jgi:hypothetical protein
VLSLVQTLTPSWVIKIAEQFQLSHWVGYPTTTIRRRAFANPALQRPDID